MYSDTSFGDYPHCAPAEPGKTGEFTGWMLLSYNKPVSASSCIKGHEAFYASDENVKSFWLAEKKDDKQWLQIDLQKSVKMYAIQI